MFRTRFPQRRTPVMSSLRPVPEKREPFAKSAPATSAPTKWTISAPSVEPSASIVTMMSPVAAANPASRASPFPLPLCAITLA